MVAGPYLVLEHKVVAPKLVGIPTQTGALHTLGKYLNQRLVISPNFKTSAIDVRVKGSDSFHHSKSLQVNDSISCPSVFQGAGPVGDSMRHTLCVMLKKGPT